MTTAQNAHNGGSQGALIGAADRPWADHALLTPQQMGEADRITIARRATGEALMEAAGLAVAAAVTPLDPLKLNTVIAALADETGAARRLDAHILSRMAPAGSEGPSAGFTAITDTGRVGADSTPESDDTAFAALAVVVCAGPGNNGGDGFVAARHLKSQGVPVELLLHGDEARLSADAAANAKRWRAAGGVIAPLTVDALDKAVLDAASNRAANGSIVIIDALLGAGLAREVTGDLAAAISQINAVRAHTEGVDVLAVDVPSGLDGATGRVRGLAVEADATVTFFRKKPGHLLMPGRALCGRVTCAQIGIEPDVLAEIAPPITTFENHPDLWTGRLSRGLLGAAAGRSAHAALSVDLHKYDRGAVLVVSGGRERAGAARLAGAAALRAGAGLVTIAAPEDAMAPAGSPPSALMQAACDSPSDFSDLLDDHRLRAIAIGPGAGVTADTRANVLNALETDAAVVLDADALTVFGAAAGGDVAALEEAIRARAAATVITPHEGEFARLAAQYDIGAAQASGTRLERARALAAALGAHVVLKGADTVIAAPDGTAVIQGFAPVWLATAGTGDVLCGLVTGLLAAWHGQGGGEGGGEGTRGDRALEAASAAVWIHAEAARQAGVGMIADDLVTAIPGALGRLVLPEQAA